MNTTELSNFTPEQKRIAIARACGWNFEPRYGPLDLPWRNTKLPAWDDEKGWIGRASQLPDYLNDLNAMHEAEMMLFASRPGYYERSWYANLVKAATELDPDNDGWGDVDTRQHSETSHATAAQRADAFLLTL